MQKISIGSTGNHLFSRKMNSIVAFGNPLLDTSVFIVNDDLLKKHNLKSDDQKQIGDEEMRNLLEDIKSYESSRSPGGCAQNTLRVMQWLFRRRCSTIMFGSIGCDENGILLRNLMESSNVTTRYIIQNEHQTGISVALINGTNRSLVANLGAAEIMSLRDFQSHQKAIDQLQASDLVYMEGFFLTRRSEVSRFIVDYCSEHKKQFAFNLSGKYLCEMEPANMKYFSEKSDILFGNRKEFEALASLIETGVDDLILNLIKERQNKMVVVTDGPHPVKCVHSKGITEHFSVPKMDLSEIVDTTGAGDAFVAGFLAGWILRRTPLNCAELGCYAAQEIIKNQGCTLPTHSPSVLLV